MFNADRCIKIMQFTNRLLYFIEKLKNVNSSIE